MSLVITKGDSGTSATKDDGSGYDWTGAVAITVQANGDTMVSGGGQQPVFWQKSDVTSIDGQQVAHNLSDYRGQLLAVFPDASSAGGGGGAFAASDGTTWNGRNQYITLSGDTTLSFDPGSRTAGQLRIIHNSHGLTLEFADSSTQVFTLTGGSAHVLLVFEVVNGVCEFEVIKDLVSKTLPAPDTTAPTITFEATDANTIVGTASEGVTGTEAGISFDNGSPLTISSMTGSGTDTLTFDIAETMTGADTITFDISGSDLEDGADNALADDSGSVTNSISSLTTLLDKTFDATLTPFVETPIGDGHAVITSGKVRLYNNVGSGDLVFLIDSSVFNPGDILHITISDVVITAGAGFWFLGSTGTTHIANVQAGTNTYIVDTSGFGNGDVGFKTDPNATSDFKVGSIKVEKE